MKLFLTLTSLVTWFATTLDAADFSREQAGRIAVTFARILEQGHYRQTPIDDVVSKQFLKNYLDSLDPNHLIFVQSDVEAFTAKYETSLDDSIKTGEVSPGYDIFAIYLKRLEQRQQLVEELLKETVDFNRTESFNPQRNKEPWPKDEPHARELWRQRVKFELLSDHLSKVKDPGSKDLKPQSSSKSGQSTKSKEAAPSEKDVTPEKPLKTAPAVSEPKKPYDPSQTITLISKRYKRLLRAMREFDSEEILQTYLTSLSHAYDPHSDYMGPTEASNFEIHNVKLSLSGIGALLRSDEGLTKIVSVVPGGPAFMSKQLRENDQIIAVAQGAEEPVDTIDMKLNKVVEMIRGTKGTQVRLTIIPASSIDGSERQVISLVRDEIKLTESQAKSRVIDHVDASGKTVRIGVINLPTFYENSSKDIEKLAARLKTEGVSGMVLDLRRNGGGLLPEAIKLAGLFIKNGPVVQVKSTDQRSEIHSDTNPGTAYAGPLVVLVSHLSASASEIVAAALQDYGRALVVGDQTTHGKGTVQTLLPLAPYMNARSVGLTNAGKIKFTVSKFYRVAGGTTQRNGVTPDIILPSLLDHMELGEASLPNALPSDYITPVPFSRLNLVAPYVGELKKKSHDRVLGAVDFSYLREDIERFRKQRAEKVISLHEQSRRKELGDDKIRKEARKTERAARQNPADKVFELTLETVNKDQQLVPLNRFGAKDNDALASNDQPSITTGADGDLDSETPDKEPELDIHLDEALNILRDLMQLMQKSQGKQHIEARLPR